MSSSPNNQSLTLNFTQFPQHLLVPSIDNLISFQATCYLDGAQDFKFEFIGENLQVEIPHELSGDKVRFNGRETKDYNIKVIPLKDGFGKLTINVNWMKTVEYTVKVQQVRDVVSSSNIKKIFKKRPLDPSLDIDSFNPKEYMVDITSEEIQQMLQEIQQKKKQYEQYPTRVKQWEQKKQAYNDAQHAASSQESSIDSPLVSDPGPKPVRQVSLEEIDNLIKKVAKAYLANQDLEKALAIVKNTSEKVDTQSFSYKLIRAHNSIDLESTLNVIQKLKKTDEKRNLIRKLALDRVSIDPEQSARIAMLIENPATKDELLKDVIIKTISSNPNKARKLCYLIEDDKIQANLLINTAKQFYQNGTNSEAAEILAELINKFINSSAFNLSENEFSNSDYEFFKDSMNGIAELESPQVTDQLIEGLSSQKLKEKVAMDLFKIIYKMVDEVRTKIEETNILSQYYMFNIYSSDVNQHIKRFSLNGGNVSNNILTHNFQFKSILLSLFGFKFSIFPTLDRVYMDLSQKSNNSFGYLIHPAKANYDKNEFNILKSVLNKFILKNQHQLQGAVSLYNIDFIPYVGKPTVIFACDESTFLNYKQKLAPIGEKVNILRDNAIFKGGEITEKLNSIFPSQKFNIQNLVLSYEFINDYNIFKAFIQSII